MGIRQVATHLNNQTNLMEGSVLLFSAIFFSKSTIRDEGIKYDVSTATLGRADEFSHKKVLSAGQLSDNTETVSK